jgi:hypothetical protein
MSVYAWIASIADPPTTFPTETIVVLVEGGVKRTRRSTPPTVCR